MVMFNVVFCWQSAGQRKVKHSSYIIETNIKYLKMSPCEK